MTKANALLCGFIVLKFALQYLLIIPEYDLHRDEYLHLDQANHLAWGYLSVPPVTSWIATLIKWLGNGVFWVRFFPALCGVLTMLVVWKTVETLKGSLYACALAATCTLFSALMRLNQLFQPNSVDVLCWTTLYFILIKYIQSGKSKWLYLFAVIFAFGFLNKYNVAFLIVGLLPSILLTKHRQLLVTRPFLVAVLIGLILISPNLLWQYQNDFPVFHHMKELAETQLVNMSRADFFKEQFLYFVGAMIVLIPGWYALLVYKPFEAYRLFFFSIVFTLSVFVFLRAKGYYAIGIYPVYIAFGAVFVSVKLKPVWLRAAFIIIPVTIFIPVAMVAFPNQTPEQIVKNAKRFKNAGLLRWEDGKDHEIPQDFADMIGWKELAEKVDAAYASSPDPGNTLVLCDNYGQAGAINYYTKKGIDAVTFNADYVNWFDLSKRYKHVVRVKNAWEREAEIEETSPLFTQAIITDSITNRYARERGATIFLFLDAKVDINGRLAKEIEESRW
ncbi:glycosyltransferase family 39 protein [Dyadobacter aurulentus]|uniref:glycosyltransferase family 39 protein n=1 Tax=Dyadobacter sp. UC 10 TaxID=2605428 RepID=UPI0011F37B89|nr:glycosyltransferase family 39 protein [Dyadobacter sp. UC 10]KAA0989130.1 glycosyltransferase family 39 protein [Dyadobacter sp. UC 10]